MKTNTKIKAAIGLFSVTLLGASLGTAFADETSNSTDTVVVNPGTTTNTEASSTDTPVTSPATNLLTPNTPTAGNNGDNNTDIVVTPNKPVTSTTDNVAPNADNQDTTTSNSSTTTSADTTKPATSSSSSNAKNDQASATSSSQPVAPTDPATPPASTSTTVRAVVSPTAPVTTESGVQIIGTDGGNVIIADGNGGSRTVAPEEVGAKKNADGTISVKTKEKTMETLPETGTAESLATSALGVLTLVGGLYLKKRNS
ncbi:MAG: LPXTG cell wall anchor domain-containing protein [Streptococcus sp.]|nr:MAG: LPXTG cell wall anchor domain-containing protein [Streptococcus sp.]